MTTAGFYDAVTERRHCDYTIETIGRVPMAYRGSRGATILLASTGGALPSTHRMQRMADIRCDGLTDATAINEAIAFVNARGGGSVLLAEALYRANEQVRLLDNVLLEGVSKRATEIRPLDAASVFDVVGGPASGYASDAGLARLTIHANKDNVAAGYGLNTSRLHRFRMQELLVKEGRSGDIFCDNQVAGVEDLTAYDVVADEPLNGTDGWNLRITIVSLLACGCLHANAGGSSFRLRGNNMKVTNCWSDHGTEATGYGFTCDRLENSVLMDCYDYKSDQIGFNQFNACRNVGFLGCWVYDAKNRAFAFQPDNVTNIGARIIGCGTRDIAVDGGRQESLSGIGAGTVQDAILGLNYWSHDVNLGGLVYNNCRIIHGTGWVTEASGADTGTGAQQAIPHGLDVIPNRVILWDIENGANPYQSAAADGANIYVTAVLNQDYGWKAEYVL